MSTLEADYRKLFLLYPAQFYIARGRKLLVRQKNSFAGPVPARNFRVTTEKNPGWSADNKSGHLGGDRIINQGSQRPRSRGSLFLRLFGP